MGGVSESDLMVLTNAVNQEHSDYIGLNVELVVRPDNNAVAPATQLTCLQLPTPDALTHSGDHAPLLYSTGHFVHSSCTGLP
jgi:hypothetical protein